MRYLQAFYPEVLVRDIGDWVKITQMYQVDDTILTEDSEQEIQSESKSTTHMDTAPLDEDGIFPEHSVSVVNSGHPSPLCRDIFESPHFREQPSHRATF